MARLHLGCGGQVFGTPGLREDEKDWINIDLGPDGFEFPGSSDLVSGYPRRLRADITDLNMIPSDFADAIHSDHALEHLSQHTVYRTLMEWRRVMKPGGHARIIVPDLLAIARKLIETDGDLLWSARGGPDGYTKLIVGIYGEDWSGPYAFHKSGFTPKYMRWCLEQAGFREVNTAEIWNHEIFSIEATAIK